ncbi:MAG: flippase-like domain-containing protein [Acidobacteria bacterium]|nr:flippase-like domain-containing protein [Acidobacteriota bacterium]
MDNSESAPAPGRSRHYRAGLWLTLALLAFAAWYLYRRAAGAGFEMDHFLRSVASADWRWLAAAWLFTMLSYYVRAVRWMVMLKPIAPGASRAAVFRATAIGFSAVYLFGRPGELVRPYLIARSSGVSFLSQMAAWLLERIYDTLIVLALFGYSLAAVVQTHPAVGPTLQWILERGALITGIACSICFGALLALQLYASRLEARILDALGFLKAHHHERVVRIVRAVVDGLRSAQCPKATSLLVLWSALEWFVIYLCFFAVLQAFPDTARLGPVEILTYIGFVAFGSLVQVPGLGGGFQIGATLVLNELFHLPLELAASVALLTWVVTLVGVVPVGAGLAFYEGLSWRSILEIEKETSA